jgi:hypothetical protein
LEEVCKENHFFFTEWASSPWSVVAAETVECVEVASLSKVFFEEELLREELLDERGFMMVLSSDLLTDCLRLEKDMTMDDTVSEKVTTWVLSMGGLMNRAYAMGRLFLESKKMFLCEGLKSLRFCLKNEECCSVMMEGEES